MSNPEYHQLTPNEISTVALEPPVKPEGFAKTQSTNYFIHDCFASLGLIISAISLVYFVILDLSTVLIVLPALGLLAVSAGCLLSYLARSRSDEKKQTYATIAFCLGAVLCLTTSAIAMRVIFADNKHAGTPRFLASSSGGYTHSYPSSTTNTNSWSVNGYSYSGSSNSASNPTYSYSYQNNQGPYSSSSSSQNQYYNSFSGSSSSSGSGPTYSFNSHSSNSGHDSSSTSTSSYSSNYYNPYYNPYAPYYEYSYGNSQDSSEESDDYTSSQNSLPNGVNVYATDSSSTYYDNEYNNGYSVYYYNGYPYYIYNGYSNSGNIYSNNQANTVYYYGPYSVSWDTYTSQYYYNSEYPYSPYNPYTSSSSSTTHGSYPRSYSEVSYAGTSDFERVFLIGLVFAQVMLFIAVIFQSNKLRGSIKEKKLLALEESFTGNQTLQI